MASGSTSAEEIQDATPSSQDARLVDTSDTEASTEHGEITVPKLLRTREEELHNRLANHKAALKSTEIPLSPEADPEKVIESIEGLQKNLHSLVTDFAQKEWIMKRLQLNTTLLEVLYPSHGMSAAGEGPEQACDEATRNEIRTLILKQCKLTSQILEAQTAMQEMRPELESTKKKNLVYLEKNRKLMSQLKERQETQANKAKKFAGNAAVQEEREKVEKQVSMIELQRNTFQGLILGSGTNWAQDEELTEVLVSLGRPLDL